MNLHFRAVIRARNYDLDFQLATGETLAIIGPNGAGKSTTIDVLAGLYRPDGGECTFGQDALFRLDGSGPSLWSEPHERQVALVPQGGLLFPHLNARDNVGFGVRARGGSRALARKSGDRWLAEVGATELADRRPRTLSGGQAQRVAIARALAVEPRLLLLDEPLASLDAESVPAVRELLAAVLQDRSAVLVTHDPLDALALAARVIVVEEGRIAQQGPTREVFMNPRTEFLRRLTFGLRG